jgi:hypothetical protein
MLKNAIKDELTDALICILKDSTDDELIDDILHDAIENKLIDAVDVDMSDVIEARDVIER